MRKALVLSLVMALGLVANAAAADAVTKRPPKAKAVVGTYDGAAGFQFGGCSSIGYVSAGTYEAKRLGRGTYALDLCVDLGASRFTGTFELVTRRGAVLNGVVDSSIGTVAVTLHGGTKRFAGATGTLLLDITRFDETNCEPRAGICFNWSEHAEITGTITKARAPKR